MAWVAFDRAVRTIERFGREGPVDRWKAARRAIREEVLREGYDAERGTFVQYFGSDRLDASLLLIPLVGFLSATDERVVGTVRAIEQELVRGGFVERYRADEENADVDGLPPGEGVFLPCSFWLAAVLAQQGRLRRGRRAVRAAARSPERPGAHLRGVRPGALATRRELPAGVHPHRDRRDRVHARRALSADGEEAPLARDALQRRDAAILELEPRAGDEVFHGARDEHLARVGLRRDARADVHGDARDLAVRELDLARVQPGTNVETERPHAIRRSPARI